MRKRIERIRLGRPVITETHAEVNHLPKGDPRVEYLIASAGVVSERRFSALADELDVLIREWNCKPAPVGLQEP